MEHSPTNPFSIANFYSQSFRLFCIGYCQHKDKIDREAFVDMSDLFKKGLSIGAGLAAVGKEQADKILKELREKGELSQQESNSLLSEIESKGEQSQEEGNQKAQAKLKKKLEELDVPTREDYERLENRLHQLERQLNKDQ